MEELFRISKEYYRTCKDVFLFGFRGWLYIILGVPFFLYSMYISIDSNGNSTFKIIFTQLIGAAFWKIAKNRYDKNLMNRLSSLTGLNNKNINEQKTSYLRYLTANIGDDLFTSLKNITELKKLYKNTRPFTPETIFERFLSFVYDPDSKSRLLSLIIYMISLIALIFVIKPADPANIYSLVYDFDFKDYMLNLWVALLFISIGYFIFMLPISIAVSYIVTPILRKFNHSGLTLNYFVHELARYSFRDVR
ncbi:hypothetical protein ABIE61_003662 [Marinobacterium sp. MBR-111]